MEAMKEIHTVKKGRIQLYLPKEYWGRQVEVIVRETVKATPSPPKKGSLRGCLRRYANPDLVHQEKDAWIDSVKDKYADHLSFTKRITKAFISSS